MPSFLAVWALVANHAPTHGPPNKSETIMTAAHGPASRTGRTWPRIQSAPTDAVPHSATRRVHPFLSADGRNGRIHSAARRGPASHRAHGRNSRRPKSDGRNNAAVWRRPALATAAAATDSLRAVDTASFTASNPCRKRLGLHAQLFTCTRARTWPASLTILVPRQESVHPEIGCEGRRPLSIGLRRLHLVAIRLCAVPRR